MAVRRLRPTSLLEVLVDPLARKFSPSATGRGSRRCSSLGIGPSPSLNLLLCDSAWWHRWLPATLGTFRTPALVLSLAAGWWKVLLIGTTTALTLLALALLWCEGRLRCCHAWRCKLTLALPTLGNDHLPSAVGWGDSPYASEGRISSR